ncbi:MAG: class I SAM-dependent methyltransferase [Candidatus Omnitrophota bacterium]|nr:class I SAM-dependent methyltransferase [Candidatus Omnitrophota bacterium]
MRKIFQNEWHGIRFKDFIAVSPVRIAAADFYKEYYKKLLGRYRDWDELDPEWVELKIQTAEFLRDGFSGLGDIRILSVGCGIGMIEKALLGIGPFNLSIAEGSGESLAWIRKHMPEEKIFVGTFPGCIPPDIGFDVIYLAGVEYCLDQEQLTALLKNVRFRLLKGGRCILISWSFEPSAFFDILLNELKNISRRFLETLGLKERGQLWGYSRNRNEFFNAMRSAGFRVIQDGMFKKKTRWDTYWVEAKA